MIWRKNTILFLWNPQQYKAHIETTHNSSKYSKCSRSTFPPLGHNQIQTKLRKLLDWTRTKIKSMRLQDALYYSYKTLDRSPLSIDIKKLFSPNIINHQLSSFLKLCWFSWDLRSKHIKHKWFFPTYLISTCPF